MKDTNFLKKIPVFDKDFSSKVKRKQTGKQPAHWQEVWDGIVEMRKDRNAPVDVYVIIFFPISIC